MSEGGPGAALSFGLYRNTRGFDRTGPEVFRHTFTGLPGTAPNTDTNSAPFVFLTIDFGATPLPLADRPIGWGYLLLDNADPSSATGALLVTAPSATTGVVDALDVYSPGPASTGTYTGTFNFGSTCNHPPCCPDASTWLQVVETPPGASVVNGSGVNPVVLAELVPPRLGQAWIVNFDLTAHPATTQTLFWISLAGQSGSPSPYGEILIDPAQRVAPAFTGQGLHVIPIPNVPSLNGLVLHAQGALRSGGVVLTNGLVTTVSY